MSTSKLQGVVVVMGVPKKLYRGVVVVVWCVNIKVGVGVVW